MTAAYYSSPELLQGRFARVNCPVPPLPARQRSTPSRRPWLLVGVPVLLLLLIVAGLFGLRLWVYGFLRGEGFRRQLDEHASSALHADGRFDPLQWQDTEVYSDAFDAIGAPGSPLAHLGAEQIRARLDLGALWHHAWRVDTIELTKFDATLASGGHTSAFQPDNDETPLPASVAPAEEHPGFLAGLLPNHFEIGEVRINDFSLAWNTGHPADAGRLRGVVLTAHPLTADNRSWQVEGHDGQLSQAYFPALRLTGFNLKTTPREVFITRAEGQADAGGHVELSGRQALDGDRLLDLRVDFDGLPRVRVPAVGLASASEGFGPRGTSTSPTPRANPAAGRRPGTSNCATGGSPRCRC